MALKPTIYKATLNLVDMNRDIYTTEKLTLALHPSETQTRMMVRLLAYALNYDEDIQFTKGLSTADEPDLWIVRPDGSIPSWIEVGQASADRLRKGVSRADLVKLYAYGSEVDIWWEKHGGAISALPKTEVFSFPSEQAESLSQLCDRNMELTITISENQLFVAAGDHQVEVELMSLSAD
ncbi:YaeQ family protein [Neptuniibacter sp.]|uniref:YaeQ family protein n=1 Tax=Neptuniibacter sp. TaxID=1962643 RepID=UPI002606D8C8|nr:YaeQ family protein [Neptuniibacter sp.]MCP4598848.1 YaeQ family protein [Neptuniibacter sp.]